MSQVFYDISDLPVDLLALEQAESKLAAELYKITWGDEGEWHYTNWHAALTFDGKIWSPCVISRGDVERGIKLVSNKVTIKAMISTSPFDRLATEYDVPVHVRLEILRYFPLEALDKAWCLFRGYITSPAVNSREVTCLCVDKTFLLERDLMRMVFQPCCNWRLGDPICSVDLSLYTASDQTIAGIDGTVISFVDLDGPDGNPAEDEYYTNGFMTCDGKKYTIVDHSQDGAGGTVTVLFTSSSMVIGKLVDLTAGCDLKVDTCFNKFGNLDKFLGFPFVPIKSPSSEIEIEDATDSRLVSSQGVVENLTNEGELIKL
jgi:uncharacterized phage protein (TIGR02218 family)